MILNSGSVLVVKNTISIYEGLALEQTLLKLHTNSKSNNHYTPSMLLWRSSSSVVLGRNQNPFDELNIPYIIHNNIDIARRDSGGGTVYQDANNLNICIVDKKNNNQQKNNLEIAVRALSSLGIECSIDDNNNILLNGDKISGSAFRYTNNLLFHHFTLLLSSDLQMLTEALHPQHDLKIVGASIPSKRASVSNLEVSLDKIIESISKEFLSTHKINQESIINIEITSLTEKESTLFNQELIRLQSDVWIWGRTPKFSIEVSYNDEVFVLFIEQGHLTTVKNITNSNTLEWTGTIEFSKKSINDLIHQKDCDKINQILTKIYNQLWRQK